jgi:murein DD-endopeptidase MepM/ murein hydrolase activator NlpD
MRLFIFTILILISHISFSQDTTNYAVDSVHRSMFISSSISKLQNWLPNVTRSQNNISVVMSMTDSVTIEIDPVYIPFDGYMTSHFGNRHGQWHPGIDIGLRVGDSVRVAWDGVVRYAMMNRGGYGNLVVVRHRNGLETYYAHLNKIKVVSGQIVKAGDLLGLGGNTGYSFGPHLHFEIRFYDVNIDPEFVVDFKEKSVHSDRLAISPKILRGAAPLIPTGVGIDEFESVEFVAGVMLPLSGKLVSNSTPVQMRSYYVVKKGDCLNKIAEKNNISVQDLCRLNGMDELKWLMVGQRLRIR